MKATVTYRDGSPEKIDISLNKLAGSVTYSVEGSTAVCTSARIFTSTDKQGREWVETAKNELERADQEVRELPFVQAVDTGEDNE